MANVITEINPNHPCHGMDCNECETCKFDIDLFSDKHKNDKNMNVYNSCHECENLIKNYVGDERLKFNACCSRSMIMFNNYSRPRIIKANTGPMIPLTPPEWCPRKRGLFKESISSLLLEEEIKENNRQLQLPTPSQVSTTSVEQVKKTYKTMTYTEKREALMSLPKHLEWDEIEEGGVYVIPKILSQSRKVVRVVIKTDTLLRCSEIDEYGKESQTLCSVYPKDIDTVFITKVLKY